MYNNRKEVKVYLDLEIDKAPLGRVVIKLYPQYAPKACENFRLLCTGEAGFSPKTGKLLSYKGTIFHRIIPGFMMQGGDFIKFNGTGNESVYGEGLPEEPCMMKHNKRGIVSMAKNGDKTNGSQFFITFAPTPWLDGIHIAFGEVVEGMEICQKVENTRTDAYDKPIQRIAVMDCGELVEDEIRERERSRSRDRSYSRRSPRSSHSRTRRRSAERKHRKHRKKGKRRKRSRDRHETHTESN